MRQFFNIRCPQLVCEADLSYCTKNFTTLSQLSPGTPGAISCCAFGRVGPLCSECPPGFSLSYTSRFCIPERKCSQVPFVPIVVILGVCFVAFKMIVYTKGSGRFKVRVSGALV